MSEEYSHWFTTDANGNPARDGVYETSALGIPGESHSVLQHGFRNWSGVDGWGDLGVTPGAAYTAKHHSPTFPFTVRHWRGKAFPPE